MTWIITEGIAGTENQCLGVSEALGVTPIVKRIALRQPWRLLSPYLGFECACTFNPPLEGPWPDLLVASGRKSIAAARYIKKASGGKTFTVQIQDPRTSLKHFDLVAVPAHDPARGANVLVTTAAPNRITDEKISSAHKEFEQVLGTLPGQRVAILIGGNSKAHKLTPIVMAKLCLQIKNLTQQGYSVMITASRRTGKECIALLEHEVKELPNIYYWNGNGPNPYFGFLAWADYILVTADSASMLSEAASTGKPVYMVPLQGGSMRLNALHKNLTDKGVIRPFEGILEPFSPQKLADSNLVAQEIRKRSGLFG